MPFFVAKMSYVNMFFRIVFAHKAARVQSILSPPTFVENEDFRFLDT